MLSIFESILSGGAPAGMFLVCLLAAGLCGAVTAFLLSLGDSRSRSFLLSLVVLPIVVALVILMVNGSVGTGIAIAALAAQASYATVQRVADPYWTPAASLGEIIANNNPDGIDLQTMLDNAVAGITTAALN